MNPLGLGGVLHSGQTMIFNKYVMPLFDVSLFVALNLYAWDEKMFIGQVK